MQPQGRAADQQEGHTLRGQDRGGQHRHRVLPGRGSRSSAPAALRDGRTIEASALLWRRLLKKSGDLSGAKAAWQRVIDSPNAECAGPAFIDLVNLLREDDDIDGLRVAYQAGAEQQNPDALYALDALGQHLEKRGDTQAAHATWQQAIDAGYEDADELRERISPPPEPAEEPQDQTELADLPPHFDPRNMLRTAIEVLEHGLPALPQTMTYQMAIPMAYWTATQNAVVLFLQFHHHRREWDPSAVMATFIRERGRWKANSHWHGTGFHDPFADPGDLRGLDGQGLEGGQRACGCGGLAVLGVIVVRIHRGSLSVAPWVTYATVRFPPVIAGDEEFPQFHIWRENMHGRRRYVARSQHLSVNPYTVITSDPGELRAALSRPE